jgi:hypothetical protein
MMTMLSDKFFTRGEGVYNMQPSRRIKLEEVFTADIDKENQIITYYNHAT